MNETSGQSAFAGFAIETKMKESTERERDRQRERESNSKTTTPSRTAPALHLHPTHPPESDGGVEPEETESESVSPNGFPTLTLYNPSTLLLLARPSHLLLFPLPSIRSPPAHLAPCGAANNSLH